MKPKYKRILLKLSGESLAGEDKHGINFDTVMRICEPIKKCNEKGVQIGIVVGGGNFWRGRSSGEMDRPRADHMGMLATCSDRYLHASGSRALYPQQGDPTHGKGQSSYLRLRNWQPVFQH